MQTTQEAFEELEEAWNEFLNKIKESLVDDILDLYKKALGSEVVDDENS